MITELCVEGDLTDLLKHERHVDPLLVVKIIKDIATGLQFLHSHDLPVIHCDIRPSNIFLKSTNLRANVCAVLGDVGFSCIADDLDSKAGIKILPLIFSDYHLLLNSY